MSHQYGSQILDHGRRHNPLPLMSMDDNIKFSKHKEIQRKGLPGKYDNYNAIEIPLLMQFLTTMGWNNGCSY